MRSQATSMKVRFFGEFLDGDAAVPQDAFFAVDEGDGRDAGAGVAETGVESDQPRLFAKLSDVQADVPFGPLDYRQIDFLAVIRQGCRPRHGLDPRSTQNRSS